MAQFGFCFNNLCITADGHFAIKKGFFMRIGIIALMHESNTFINNPTTLDDFRRESLLTGQAIVNRWASAPHEIGGFLAGVQSAGAEAVPIFAAWAMPSGAVAADAYQKLLEMMMESLDDASSLDGLLLAPHGAGVSESYPDMDGHWLSLVRQRVGPNVPMIATLDPHANLSQQMVDSCDATIGYRTNPHLDQREVGLEAADLMVRTLRREVRLTQAASFPTIAINIERQTTAEVPCRPMYEYADSMLQRDGVLSNSVLLGFAFADVAEMGTSFIVVTDNDQVLAQQYADELGGYLWEHRLEFIADLKEIDNAIDLAIRSEKPVCLLDMGDNVGGGSPGDGTFLAHVLEARQFPRGFVCIHDPESVQQAQRAGIGNRISLRIGGKTDRLHGPPLERVVTVRSLHDGEYTESEVRHGGRSWGTMGRTAIVESDGGLTIQLTSLRDAPISLQQIRCCGLDPASFQILVAKGVVAPIAAYREVCPTIIRVNTPGCTSADLESFDYQHRRRPLFPFER